MSISRLPTVRSNCLQPWWVDSSKDENTYGSWQIPDIRPSLRGEGDPWRQKFPCSGVCSCCPNKRYPFRDATSPGRLSTSDLSKRYGNDGKKKCEIYSCRANLSQIDGPIDSLYVHTCFIVVTNAVVWLDRFATLGEMCALGQIQAIGKRRGQQTLAAGRKEGTADG